VSSFLIIIVGKILNQAISISLYIVLFINLFDNKYCSNRGSKESDQTKETGHRVAFRTRSKIDVMDDGFKWRKYGKKSVKNNINKR